MKMFYFKNKNRVQKNEIKDVCWPVTAKMTTSAQDPEVRNVTESWSYQYQQFWGHFPKGLLMTSSNPSKTPQNFKKSKKFGGVMDVYAASFVGGTYQRPSIFELC